jgi:hypothetical protein
MYLHDLALGIYATKKKKNKQTNKQTKSYKPISMVTLFKTLVSKKKS